MVRLDEQSADALKVHLVATQDGPVALLSSDAPEKVALHVVAASVRALRDQNVLKIAVQRELINGPVRAELAEQKLLTSREHEWDGLKYQEYYLNLYSDPDPLVRGNEADGPSNPPSK